MLAVVWWWVTCTNASCTNGFQISYIKNSWLLETCWWRRPELTRSRFFGCVLWNQMNPLHGADSLSRGRNLWRWTTVHPFLLYSVIWATFIWKENTVKWNLKGTGGLFHVCLPLLSFPITVNSKYLLLSLGLYKLNTEVPVLGCNLKVVRMKASFTPCSARPPCSRSGRQSGEVSRS